MVRFAPTQLSSWLPMRCPKLPNAPEHMKSYLVADTEFRGDYGEDLVKRFNAWLAQ